jgi:hypothetical protein
MSALDDACPDWLEVCQSLNTFWLPGVQHRALTGRISGLWRSRGRAADQLFGIGCCGEGTRPGVPKAPTEASKDPKFTWTFKDIEDSELIGVEALDAGHQAMRWTVLISKLESCQYGDACYKYDIFG